MTEGDKFALLRDLAVLIKRYGPSAFSELARCLRDPKSVQDLVSILEAGETAGRRARVKEGRSGEKGRDRKASIRHMLSLVAESEPEKAQALLAFCEEVFAKRAVPTLRELRSFVADNGLKPLSGASRENALPALFRDLAAHPIEDLRRMLSRIPASTTSDERGLEGWADVILGKERTPRR